MNGVWNYSKLKFCNIFTCTDFLMECPVSAQHINVLHWSRRVDCVSMSSKFHKTFKRTVRASYSPKLCLLQHLLKVSILKRENDLWKDWSKTYRHTSMWKQLWKSLHWAHFVLSLPQNLHLQQYFCKSQKYLNGLQMPLWLTAMYSLLKISMS